MAYELKTTIRSNQFMIVVFDKDSRDFCIRNDIYDTYAKALHVAQESASEYDGFKFIVVAVAAIAQQKSNPVIVTSYKL